MKQHFIDKAGIQTRKDNRVRRIEIVTAEAVINSLQEQGFMIQADYLENVAQLQVAFKNGKTVKLQVNYKNLAGGYDNLLALLNMLQ